MFKQILRLALVALSLATVVGLAQPENPPPGCFPCCGPKGDQVCPEG